MGQKEARKDVQTPPHDELGAPKDLPVRHKFHMIGPKPRERNESGKPLNNSACLFFPHEGLTDDIHLIPSRPNHNAGAMKMAFLMAYTHGEGPDIPALGVKADTIPSFEALDEMVKIGFGTSDMEGAADVKRLLHDSSDKYMMPALESYVPLVIRGVGKEIEICVRKDPNVSLEMVDRSIKILDEEAGIPDGRIKAVASDPGSAEKLRDHFEGRGQLWRLYPPSKTKDVQEGYIENSKILTDNGVALYYVAGSGGRLLSEAEFGKVVDSFATGKSPREKLIGQLNDLVGLRQTKNRMGMPNLSLSMADEDKFRPDTFRKALGYISKKRGGKYFHDDEKVNALLTGIRRRLHDCTKEGFHTDDLDSNRVRHALYNRLTGQSAFLRPEEMKLGLSRAYHGEVEWQPGGTVIADEKTGEWAMMMSPNARNHTKAIITDYADFSRKKGLRLSHINVGEVIESLSKRDKLDPDERREVYLVEWSAKPVTAEGRERKNQVDLLRRQRYDSIYFLTGMDFDLGDGKGEFKHHAELKKMRDDGSLKTAEDGREYMEVGGTRAYGRRLSIFEAKRLTDEYTRFNLQRNKFERLVFPGHSNVAEVLPVLERTSEIGGHEVLFFIRPYVKGTAVDKIPDERYGNPEFAKKIAGFMGAEAARNFTVGRVNKYTGEIVYADGDEIIQTDKPMGSPDAMPVGIARPDGTSVLGDVDRKPGDFAPAYAGWISKLMKTAAENGAGEVKGIGDAFLDSFEKELIRIQGRIVELGGTDDDLGSKFKPSKDDLGAPRYGWKGCSELVPKTVERASGTDARWMREQIAGAMVL